MNPIPADIFEKANEAAVYNLYLYLADKTIPAEKESLRVIVLGLEAALKHQTTHIWKEKDIYRLQVLRNAVNRNAVLANSRISNLVCSKSGLTACAFTTPDGEVFVGFKGTGSGEWLDNGAGLSGIPEENTYMTYSRNGEILSYRNVQNDYASDQQAEALNWFRRIAAQNGWKESTRIILCGHSKGGNKAQFVTIHSDLADECYSFNGQGFSPEALAAFRDQYRDAYEVRRRKMRSFAAENDFVNVLGERLVPEDQIYYLESSITLHPIESILDIYGQFYPQCEQGKLSRYIESISGELMDMPPFIRQYATLGIMSIFQKHMGKDTPVNENVISIEDTLAGISAAVGVLLRRLYKNRVDDTDLTKR